MTGTTQPAGRPEAAQHSGKRVVFATAGHVDHGKTSLIRALTGTDTDRLPDEKRRGISIELGFAELAGTGISFIDVPGHHKLVHAMIAGVGGVDALLLVVAADDGVMPQTREHLHVAALLGIERVLVALTKLDLVDAETAALAEADVLGTLESMNLEAVAVVHTSTLTGSGLPEMKQALEALAEAIPSRASSARLWLPIDRVFSVKGAGAVITGTLTRGSLSVGDTVYLVSERDAVETQCRALQIHGHRVERAEAPTRLAVNLARMQKDQVKRGNVLTFDAELCRSTRLDIELRVVPDAERALEDKSPVLVHIGTARVAGRILHIDQGLAQLSLESALPCQGAVGVILRGFSSTRLRGRVLGGGRVLDAAGRALRRRDAKGIELTSRCLNAIRERAWQTALLLCIERSAPRPIDAIDIERRLGLEPGELDERLTSKKTGRGPAAVRLADSNKWTNVEVLESLMVEQIHALERFHAEHPFEVGASLEMLRTGLAERVGRELSPAVFERALRRGAIVISKQGLVYLAGFAQSSAAQAAQKTGDVASVLERVGLQGISEAALSLELSEPLDVLRKTLARLSAENAARRLGGIWFSERCLDGLRAGVREHLSREPSLSVVAFKELVHVSRKQAIPLLEQLDREGTTRRQGDERVLGATKHDKHDS